MDEAKQIYTLIPKIMAEIGAVSKDSRNAQQNYAFRGIEQFYKAAHPVLAKHGVFCVPEVVEHSATTFEKANFEGKVTVWRHVTIKVRHRFYAGDGSFVDVITVGEGLDNSDKSSYKSMSGAMKYAFIELFSIPTEDVEDADRTSPEAGKPVTLAPTAPVKLPDVKVPVPVPPEDSLYIDTKQRAQLARRFRESLRPELGSQADECRHAALKVLSDSLLYKSKFADELGNPSHDYILKTEYASIGKALVTAAKSL